MAPAAGKKEWVSLSLFMEMNNLEVEEELFTLATQAWAEGTWIGKWPTEAEGSVEKADVRSSHMERS